MGKTYCVYITTNPSKEVLYIGVTNDLARRILEHQKSKGNQKTFTGRYYCYKLLYYEVFENIEQAIQREKQLKKWSRVKKENLISENNPNWIFLNASLLQY